jgi:hypothetical protein
MRDVVFVTLSLIVIALFVALIIYSHQHAPCLDTRSCR